MTTTEAGENEDRPDVEKIMQGIREDLAQAARSLPEPDPLALEPENNLYASLRLINQAYPVEMPPAHGLKGALRTRLFALLSAPFASITRFHAATTHALNKIVKLLDGTHDDLTGEVLQKTRNRMDLIEQLSRRIESLEQRLAQLEAGRKTGKSAP